MPNGNKKHDANLPGMGGVFNSINLDGYQYCGMNPVRFVDPDGRMSEDEKTSKKAEALGENKQEQELSQSTIKTLQDEGWNVFENKEEKEKANEDLKSKASEKDENNMVSSKEIKTDTETDLTESEKEYNEGVELRKELIEYGSRGTVKYKGSEKINSIKLKIKGLIFKVAPRNKETGEVYPTIYRQYIDINNDGYIDAWKGIPIE